MSIDLLIRFSLALMLCLAGARFANAQTGDAARFELSDGSAIEGRLIAIDGDSVTLETGGKEKVLACQDVGLIRSQPPTPVSNTFGRVKLVDGSLLNCQSIRVEDRKLAVTTVCESELEFDTRLVDAAQFLVVAEQDDTAWRSLLAKERESDALVVRRDEKLQMVDGLIGDVAKDTVSFTVGDRRADVKRERLTGLLFYRRYREKVLPPKFVVELTDGSTVRAQSLKLTDAGVLVVSMCAAELTVGVDAIASVDFREGRAVWLSDLEPATNAWVPLLAGGTVLERLTEFSIARFDQNFRGRTLELLVFNKETGVRVRKDYARGFAIKGGAKLSYVLAKQYQKLTGLVGFDPAANSSGVVKLIIRVDDDPRIEQILRASEMDRPLAIDVDLKDASRIVFEIDYEDRRDVGDILHAVEMKLHR